MNDRIIIDPGPDGSPCEYRRTDPPNREIVCRNLRDDREPYSADWWPVIPDHRTWLYTHHPEIMRALYWEHKS